MPQLPTIYAIQASDAPQHIGKLQEILQNLQAEKRIGSFKTLGVEDDLSAIKKNIQDEDLILIILTRQLESQKEQIINSFNDIKTSGGVRIGEIIVDNVPYENEFITFPADLRPIRNREDMDAVWGSIEENLSNIFPVHESDMEAWNLPEWLRGTLEWPWESPGRWHGALFLGLIGSAFVVVAQFLNYINDPRGISLFEMVGFGLLIGGVLYAIAGAVSRMLKASLFFAVAYAAVIMILWIISFGTYEDVVGAALILGGPISAIVGACVGRSLAPFRLSGMIFLGLWPWLFVESAPYDSAFLFNSVIIAVVLCTIAWLKPVTPKRAVKNGSLPFALNLAGGYLIYMMASDRGLEGSAFGLTIITVIAALSLGLVYWLNKKKMNGTIE